MLLLGRFPQRAKIIGDSLAARRRRKMAETKKHLERDERLCPPQVREQKERQELAEMKNAAPRLDARDIWPNDDSSIAFVRVRLHQMNHSMNHNRKKKKRTGLVRISTNVTTDTLMQNLGWGRR